MRSSVAATRRLTIPPFLARRFFLYAKTFRLLAHSNRSSKFSPEIALQHADARGLFDGLIWPKTGCASIV
ncbi:MAG: hypothetical protein CL533_00890 [Afipia sp.]|nr:hypothetical protein [Afipia sp.]OUX63002.1 MAG: hypothetical protein CBB64_00885 [Afipia sp. TMED4]HBF55421.1 hypothetical protein [Afipia sp.]HCX18493.1 hypothetical protein [Afipia sp.]